MTMFPSLSSIKQAENILIGSPTKVQKRRKGRVCKNKECKKTLTIYNLGKYCFTCKKKGDR